MARTPFDDALADIPYTVPHDLAHQCSRHFALLSAWTQVSNLTAIREPAQAAWLHYRDSLEGLALLGPGPVVDMGSGGGFPGMVLAMARPDVKFVLVEPRAKRASFLRTAAARLDLKNTEVIVSRLETPPKTGHFAQALSRATFSDMQHFSAFSSWLMPHGSLLAWRSSPADRSNSSQATPSITGMRHEKAHRYRIEQMTRRIDVWISTSLLA